MKILQIKASVFNGNGQSSRLADAFVALLRKQDPKVEVIQRDLAAEPVPHLDGARVGAFFAKPQERSAEQQAVIAYSHCSMVLITCNDGQLDDGEDCDDGNMSSIDECTTSCTLNDKAIAAACERSTGKDEADITSGTITNCDNVPAITNLELGCTLSNEFFGQSQVYAAGGDCTMIATKCMGALCGLAPPDFGNYDGDVTCPAGHTLIEKTVMSVVNIDSKVCVRNCERDRDCRWNEYDSYWKAPGQYRCGTSDLSPNQKYCHDAQNDML